MAAPSLTRLTRLTRLLPTALSLLLLLPAPAACDFSLNTPGPDWDYTASDLANTTSQACKTAFGASIACTATLLGVTASMRPGFDPQQADFEAMCVQPCADSIDAWIKNVEGACAAPGDLAQQAQGNTGVPGPKVQVVGEVFRYMYDRSCRKDASGNFCTLSAGDVSQTANFTCDDTCAVQYFADAHNDPGSAWEFNYYYLVPQTPYWEQTFQQGWAVAQKCGAVDTNPAADANATTTTASGAGDGGGSTVIETAPPPKPTPEPTGSGEAGLTAGVSTTDSGMGSMSASTTTAGPASSSTSSAAGAALLGHMPRLEWVGLGLLAVFA